MRRLRYTCEGDEGAVSSGFPGGAGGALVGEWMGVWVGVGPAAGTGREPLTARSSSGVSVPEEVIDIAEEEEEEGGM